MKFIGINRASALAILVLAIGVLFTGSHNNSFHPPSSVSAFHFFPWTKFYLNFENQITNMDYGIVRLECEKFFFGNGRSPKLSHKLNVVWLLKKQSWGFDFRTGLEEVEYRCEYRCLGDIHGVFTAFVDVNQFGDKLCGGRHCNWMFNDDGLYLFNLEDGKYHQKINFKGAHRVSKGTGNGTESGGVVLRNFDPRLDT